MILCAKYIVLSVPCHLTANVHLLSMLVAHDKVELGSLFEESLVVLLEATLSLKYHQIKLKQLFLALIALLEVLIDHEDAFVFTVPS